MLSSRRKIDLRTFRRVARKLPRLKEMTEPIIYEPHFQIFSKLASRKLRIDFFSIWLHYLPLNFLSLWLSWIHWGERTWLTLERAQRNLMVLPSLGITRWVAPPVVDWLDITSAPRSRAILSISARVVAVKPVKMIRLGPETLPSPSFSLLPPLVSCTPFALPPFSWACRDWKSLFRKNCRSGH